MATKQYIQNVFFKLTIFELLVSVKECNSYTSVVHCLYNENLEPCNSLFLKYAFMPTSLVIVSE